MSINSTIKLWHLLSKEGHSSFDWPVHKILSEKQLEPKKETINKIVAYACSVKGVKIKSNHNILISLN